MAMSSNWFPPTNADTSGSVPSHIQLTFAISELQDLLAGIASLREVVHSAPYLYSRSGAVLPVECDRLMTALSKSCAVMEKGIVLLRPPDAFGSYNYPLLAKLHSAVDKISILLHMSERLRSSCAGDDSETTQILTKLQGELSKLLHEQEKIEQEIEIELDALLLSLHP